MKLQQNKIETQLYHLFDFFNSVHACFSSAMAWACYVEKTTVLNEPIYNLCLFGAHGSHYGTSSRYNNLDKCLTNISKEAIDFSLAELFPTDKTLTFVKNENFTQFLTKVKPNLVTHWIALQRRDDMSEKIPEKKISPVKNIKI